MINISPRRWRQHNWPGTGCCWCIACPNQHTIHRAYLVGFARTRLSDVLFVEFLLEKKEEEFESSERKTRQRSRRSEGWFRSRISVHTHRHSPPWLGAVCCSLFFLSSTEQPYHQTELERRNGARPHQGDVARACFSRLRFNPHRPWQTLCAIRLIRLLLRSALLLLVCVCVYVCYEPEQDRSKIGMRAYNRSNS